jgi:hemerythrin-like domain-containing protein
MPSLIALPTTRPRPDTYDMVVVHRVFERELALLPALVRAVRPGDTARATLLASHFRVVADLLHHHGVGEDELIWPLVVERASGTDPIVREMEVQHARLHELIDDGAALAVRWALAGDAESRDELASVLEELSVAAGEHLRDEEEKMLHLIEEHLTVAEWDALGQEGQSGRGKRELLLILGLMLEDATDEEREKFLGALPIHARLVWRRYGAHAYRRYVRRVRGAAAVAG